MHPKQICSDIESMGAKLVLDEDDLFIENPEKVYPELIEFTKSYKSRIITYLKGDYSDKDHAIKQTIDKILLFMSGVEQDMNPKINSWLNSDVKAMAAVMQLTIDLHNNGWFDCKEPIANYETVETEKLSQEIFDLAMAFFKKGA